MYLPANEQERLLLIWAWKLGIYPLSCIGVDQSFRDVWLRVLRTLNAQALGESRYWEVLRWLDSAGRYLQM